MDVAIFIIIVAIEITIAYFVGEEFARIAEMKGHKERKYFWWTFLLMPVGMAMVIALPTCAAGTGKAAKNDELPDI